MLRRITDRTKAAADTLKDEYRKGLDGDESPTQRIGPTAVDVIKSWMARNVEETDEVSPDQADTVIDEGSPNAERVRAPEGDDAREVADLLGRADWSKVSAAVRDHQATQRMRDLAAQVDWSAAKPVAARVASVLIAAAAAGELGGLQGTAGRYVARTIANETGLADRVAQRLAQQRTPQNESLVAYIDTTATEMSADAGGSGFEGNLTAIERLGDTER